MSDYIDRDLLLAEIEELKKSPWYNDCGENYERIVRSDAIGTVVDLCVKSAPVADVQEVKHGEWIESGYYGNSCGKPAGSNSRKVVRNMTKECNLNPCPFCGGRVHFDTLYSDFRDVVIYCGGCDMIFALDDYTAVDSDLVKAWNRRYSND